MTERELKYSLFSCCRCRAASDLKQDLFPKCRLFFLFSFSLSLFSIESKSRPASHSKLDSSISSLPSLQLFSSSREIQTTTVTLKGTAKGVFIFYFFLFFTSRSLAPAAVTDSIHHLFNLDTCTYVCIYFLTHSMNSKSKSRVKAGQSFIHLFTHSLIHAAYNMQHTIYTHATRKK